MNVHIPTSRRLQVPLLAVGFALITLFFAGPAPARMQVNLTSGEWGPYLSEKLPQGGLAALIVTRAFAQVDVDVHYGYFPWKRSYKYAKDGRDPNGNTWHGTVIWVYTEERARDFLFTAPVILDDEVLFSLKEKPVKWKTIRDLKGTTIGGTLHTVYPVFEEAEMNNILTLYRALNYDMLFKRLLKHRIDAVPQVSRVGMYYLHTTLTEDERKLITHSPTVIQRREYRIMISRNANRAERIVDLFNTGLQMLKNSGEYDKLLNSGEYAKFNLQ